MKAKPWWRSIGPGLISGASENDPTTVASMAVIGATTIYALGWLVILVAPMLAVVQSIGVHVAGVTKRQLQEVVLETYGKAAAWILLIPLVAVNLVTLAADLQGGAAAMQLLAGGNARWYVVPIAALVAGFLIWDRYERVRRVMMVIPLAFLAYVGAAILARPDWHAVLMGSLIPHLRFDTVQTSAAIALLGTTLTAYAYVWITIEISTERPPLRLLGLIELDSVVGTIVAVASCWFILIATGATLGVRHHSVQTAADAAQALAPLAGRYASIVFAVGLLGSALLALPVIAATTGYATATMFGWKEDLDASLRDAPRFYAIIAGSLAFSAVAGLFDFSAVKLLFFSSIAGGLATPVSLTMLMLVAGNRSLLGSQTAPRWLVAAGWCVTGVVTTAAIAFLVQLL